MTRTERFSRLAPTGSTFGVRLGWWWLTAGLFGIVVAYGAALTASGATWPALLVAMAIPIATAGVTLLGIGRRAGPAAIAAVCLVHVVVAVGLALAVAGARWVAGAWHGVPYGTVVVFLAAGAIPLVLLPVVYAITFSRDQLDEATVSRVRSAARQVAASEPA